MLDVQPNAFLPSPERVASVNYCSLPVAWQHVVATRPLPVVVVPFLEEAHRFPVMTTETTEHVGGKRKNFTVFNPTFCI